jgi:hypothetical protein
MTIKLTRNKIQSILALCNRRSGASNSELAEQLSVNEEDIFSLIGRMSMKLRENYSARRDQFGVWRYYTGRGHARGRGKETVGGGFHAK